MTDDQSELFVVVDKDDQVIGYRTRYDCHHDKSLIHRAVGIVITNDKGEILLQKRSQKKDTGKGLFDIASSGHVAKGESYREAAKRELKEELGVTASLTFVKKFLLHLPHETEFDEIFRAHHNGPFKVNKEEIDAVFFVKPSDITENKFKITKFAKKALQTAGVL